MTAKSAEYTTYIVNWKYQSTDRQFRPTRPPFTSLSRDVRKYDQVSCLRTQAGENEPTLLA